MSKERFPFNNESDVRMFCIISIVSYHFKQLILAIRCILKLRTWVSIKDVNVFQIILSITSSDNE